MTDEEYVRARFPDSHELEGRYGTSLVWLDKDAVFGDWAAAAEFTRERLEQIRQLTYEISLLKLIHAQGDRSEWHPIDHEDDQDALLRSSRRLESALAYLKRGMRTAGLQGRLSECLLIHRPAQSNQKEGRE